MENECVAFSERGVTTGCAKYGDGTSHDLDVASKDRRGRGRMRWENGAGADAKERRPRLSEELHHGELNKPFSGGVSTTATIAGMMWHEFVTTKRAVSSCKRLASIVPKTRRFVMAFPIV